MIILLIYKYTSLILYFYFLVIKFLKKLLQNKNLPLLRDALIKSIRNTTSLQFLQFRNVKRQQLSTLKLKKYIYFICIND